MMRISVSYGAGYVSSRARLNWKAGSPDCGKPVGIRPSLSPKMRFKRVSSEGCIFKGLLSPVESITIIRRRCHQVRDQPRFLGVYVEIIQRRDEIEQHSRRWSVVAGVEGKEHLIASGIPVEIRAGFVVKVHAAPVGGIAVIDAGGGLHQILVVGEAAVDHAAFGGDGR